MKSLLLVTILFLASCDGTVLSTHQWTPEEQGDMIKRCEANGMDWHMFDYGRIICHKKETK